MVDAQNCKGFEKILMHYFWIVNKWFWLSDVPPVCMLYTQYRIVQVAHYATRKTESKFFGILKVYLVYFFWIIIYNKKRQSNIIIIMLYYDLVCTLYQHYRQVKGWPALNGKISSPWIGIFDHALRCDVAKSIQWEPWIAKYRHLS